MFRFFRRLATDNLATFRVIGFGWARDVSVLGREGRELRKVAWSVVVYTEDVGTEVFTLPGKHKNLPAFVSTLPKSLVQEVGVPDVPF